MANPCVTFYKRVVSISHTKLLTIVKTLDDVSESELPLAIYEEEEIGVWKSKKTRILDFLAHLYNDFTEPVPGIQGDIKLQLTHFFNQKSVLLFLAGH